MKKRYFLLLLSGISLFAQSNKDFFSRKNLKCKSELYVAFETTVRFGDENYAKALEHQLPELKNIVDKYAITFEKGITLSDAKLDFMAAEARRISKSDAAVQKLKNILRINVPNPTNEKLIAIAVDLENLPDVAYCCFMPLEAIMPPTDIAPTTNDYEPNQSYLGPDPGVNMNYAWNRGLSGSGIRVRDVEYGFNPNHEDLNSVNVFIAPGMTINSSATTSYTEHGTPVFGIVMAHKGSYGISGMAFGAQEMVLYPEWQQTGYSRVNAVTEAIAHSQAGDVILYEMQAYGEGGTGSTNYVPAEYSQVIWDLTKAATDAGIIIVEAAANGNQDLDAPFYAPYMSRGDSGAIIVGAGTATLAHNRMSYSTYGSRVDVQGWAENVFACGYGDVIQVGADFNQGYTNFAGTSAATPMVAACVIVLQSYYFGLTGTYLSPLEMRTLLKTTGIPQGTGVAGNIGPLPNMQAALLQIDSMLATQDFRWESVLLYPNPAKNTVTIRLLETSSPVQVVIYDAVGHKVLEQKDYFHNSVLDIASLPIGVYFVTIAAEGKKLFKKLVKQ